LSMLHVRADGALLFMLHISLNVLANVHVSCPRWLFFPRWTSILHVHTGTAWTCLCCMSLPNFHASCPGLVFMLSMSMLHIQATCPCRNSILHARVTCSCCTSILHVLAACPRCTSMLYV
jgi:hypothetical protein